MNATATVQQREQAPFLRGRFLLFLFAAALLISLSWMTWYARNLQAEVTKLQSDYSHEQSRWKGLSSDWPGAPYVEHLKDTFTSRVTVISALRANQLPTPDVMAALSKTLGAGTDVRIESINWTGKRLSFRLQAASPDALSRFQDLLQRSSAFSCTAATAQPQSGGSAQGIGSDLNCTFSPKPEKSGTKQVGRRHRAGQDPEIGQ